MRSVLMVAFHYPPSFGSSGVQRTLKFSRHLPALGWKPLVLTAHERAHPEVSQVGMADIPADAVVSRAFAIDSRRHLAVRGSSLRMLGVPDQWISWWLGAVPAGLRLVRRHRPAVIWSTYPIATAPLVALTLHRLTAIPWVADFRDPMVDADYPSHGPTRRIHQWIERRAAASAACLVFTTPTAKRDFLSRHPGVAPERCLVISNGYDEADFSGAPRTVPTAIPSGEPVRLVHAGFVYQDERDPRPLFRALARLRKDGRIEPASFRLDLRAPGTPEYYVDLIERLDLQGLVYVLPPLPYRESLRDSAAASALLILQGAACNHQIPAKAYEYLRIGRPILALTPAEGDTGALIAECGGATRMDLMDEDALHAQLPRFLDAVREGRHPLPAIDPVQRYARQSQARQLAARLDEVARS
jgi:glycosyltransferase involved in cell wall biosynthesis